MAKIKKKSEFAGIGCLFQGVGLVLLFWFPFGTIMGVILLFYGSFRSIVLKCGDCGNTVERGAKLCPTCKAQLGKHAKPAA